MAEASTVVQSGFGLTFRSDEILPGLLPGRAASVDEVRVHLQCMPTWLEGATSRGAETLYPGPGVEGALLTIRSVAGDHLLLEYRDGTRILMEPGGTGMWATWLPEATLEDTATYLLGPAAALLLRMRGVVPLHASAVEIGGRAVAFAGASGCGKSTTAAAFARRGHRVVTDDITALVPHDGVMHVQPSFPRLRLWPESVHGLFGRADALPLVTPNWDKRYLDDDAGPAQAPLPLHAVCILEPGDEKGPPRLERLAGRAALIALLSNTTANHVLTPAMRALDLETLASVSEGVPVLALHIPPGFDRLPDMCRLVEGLVAGEGDGGDDL
jgi:hypothetical protein